MNKPCCKPGSVKELTKLTRYGREHKEQVVYEMLWPFFKMEAKLGITPVGFYVEDLKAGFMMDNAQIEKLWTLMRGRNYTVEFEGSGHDKIVMVSWPV